MNKVLELDRLVIMVRDIDKALEFFAGKLGMKFLELDKDISERDGVRSYVCHDTHLHLISPILPLPANAAPPMRERVKLLEENEAIFQAIVFKVDDIQEVKDELIKDGNFLKHEYKESHDYKSIGMDNFAEAVFSLKENSGLIFAVSSYDRNKLEDKKDEAAKDISLDRIVMMVNDMNKTLDLLSVKMGMEFRELDKEIQKRDGNRGMVCHDTHLHLVSPILPLPETAPPPLRQGAQMVKEKGSMVLVVLFKVDNPMKKKEELEKQGIGILRVWEKTQDYESVGMNNLEEFLIDSKDTFGIPVCLSNYDVDR